jgi:hypothetical protein
MRVRREASLRKQNNIGGFNDEELSEKNHSADDDAGARGGGGIHLLG